MGYANMNYSGTRLMWTPRGHAKVYVLSGVRIKRVNFRENISAFHSSGQTKLSVISGCPY